MIDITIIITTHRALTTQNACLVYTLLIQANEALNQFNVNDYFMGVSLRRRGVQRGAINVLGKNVCVRGYNAALSEEYSLRSRPHQFLIWLLKQMQKNNEHGESDAKSMPSCLISVAYFSCQLVL